MIGKPSEKQKEKLRYIFVTAAVTTGFLMLVVFNLYALWVVLVLAVLYMAYVFTEKHFYNRNNYTLGKVFPLGKTGFSASRNGKTRHFYWNNLEAFSWLGSWLCFDFEDGSCICIKETLEGANSILPFVPRNKASEAGNRLIDGVVEEENEKASAQTCKICGFMAIIPGEGIAECRVCDTTTWSHSSGEKQEVYIHRMALEHFSILEETETVDFFPKENYPQDPKWKPPVTEEEVRKYSQEKWPHTYSKKPVIDISRSQPCMVCGFYAIPHPDDPTAEGDFYCRVCFSEEWTVSLGMNEMDYLRECQLDHFGTWDPEEKVVFYPVDVAYRPVPHWKPRVTETEVLEYSKKENWD